MKKLIIGSGHGTETPGKRSIFHKKKGIVRLKENNFNEAICNKISYGYDNCAFITPEWNDISLLERIQRERIEFTTDSIFLSVHADAYHVKDAAKGGLFYYYSNKGYDIAVHLTKYFIANGYDLKLRPVKQANFYVLKNSKSPAVLFEAGFMTSEHDLKYLESESFRNKTAKLLIDAFKTYQ